MKFFVFIILIIISLHFSCTEKQDEILFKTGRHNLGDYVSLNPPVSINLENIKNRNDTIHSILVTTDTLILNIDDDIEPELTFIITQQFNPEFLSTPDWQTVYIIASYDINMLTSVNKYMVDNMPLVWSVQFDEIISRDEDWIDERYFFLTDVRRNVLSYPRRNFPYIPFLYKYDTLGWLKLNIEEDQNMRMLKFEVSEYCLYKP